MRKRNLKHFAVVALALTVAFTGVIATSCGSTQEEGFELSVVKKMEADLKSVSDEEFDREFLSLLETMYGSAENENLIVDAFYWQMFDAEEKGVSYEEGAKSHAFRGFLRDLKDNNLMIKNDVLYGYLVTPDLKYMMDHFGERMSDPLHEYMEFRIYELDNHLYNVEIETLDIPEILSRIDRLDSFLDQEDFGYHETYQELRGYYVNKLIGADHAYFVDYKKDPVWFSDYALIQYEKIIAERDGDLVTHIEEILLEGPMIL